MRGNWLVSWDKFKFGCDFSCAPAFDSVTFRQRTVVRYEVRACLETTSLLKQRGSRCYRSDHRYCLSWDNSHVQTCLRFNGQRVPRLPPGVFVFHQSRKRQNQMPSALMVSHRNCHVIFYRKNYSNQQLSQNQVGFELVQSQPLVEKPTALTVGASSSWRHSTPSTSTCLRRKGAL